MLRSASKRSVDGSLGRRAGAALTSVAAGLAAACLSVACSAELLPSSLGAGLAEADPAAVAHAPAPWRPTGSFPKAASDPSWPWAEEDEPKAAPDLVEAGLANHDYHCPDGAHETFRADPSDRLCLYSFLLPEGEDFHASCEQVREGAIGFAWEGGDPTCPEGWVLDARGPSTRHCGRSFEPPAAAVPFCERVLYGIIGFAFERSLSTSE